LQSQVKRKKRQLSGRLNQGFEGRRKEVLLGALLVFCLKGTYFPKEKNGKERKHQKKNERAGRHLPSSAKKRIERGGGRDSRNPFHHEKSAFRGLCLIGERLKERIRSEQLNLAVRKSDPEKMETTTGKQKIGKGKK